MSRVDDDLAARLERLAQVDPEAKARVAAARVDVVGLMRSFREAHPDVGLVLIVVDALGSGLSVTLSNMDDGSTQSVLHDVSTATGRGSIVPYPLAN